MSVIHHMMIAAAAPIPVTIKAQEVYSGTDFTNIVGTITDPLGTTQSFSQGTTVSVRPNVQYTIDITSISTGSGNEPVLYNSQFTFTLGGNTDNYYFGGDVLLVRCKYASRMVINLYDYNNSQQLPSTTQVKYDVYVGTTPVMQDVVVDNGYIIHLKSILDQISTLAGTTINTIGLKITGILDANSQPITDFESIDNTQWLTLNNDYSITLTGDNFTLSPTSFANNGTIVNINLFIPDYLCFTALEAGQFTLTIPAAVTSTYLSYVEWSKDGRTWNHTDNTSEAVTIDVQVASGEKVYWRGSGKMMTMSSYGDGRASYFSSTCRFDASGNLMSLLTDDFANVTTWSHSYTFASLFKGCTTLISAKDMVLTLTTLPSSMFIMTFNGASSMVSALTMDITDAGDNCFNLTFQGCSALTDISGLKMTLGQLRTKVLYYTFRSCTSLVTPPSVSFTSFAASSSENCLGMFYDCSSLESSFPLLPTTLVSKCYNAMFNNCRNLSSVKCLATDISATNCISNWLSNVSSTGAFIQASGVTWPSGASGIPTGWVDIEKRTMPSGYKQVEYVANPNKPSSGGAPYIETGIVLDPSQDTIEIAIFPTFDEDGYVAHYQYGGMPLANNSSPNVATAKVGRFYWLFRKNESINMIQFSATIVSGGSSYVSASNITSNPQVLKVVTSPTSFTLYLNGTQVGTRTGINVDTSDMGTETAKLYGYNSVYYNWIDPIYYMKWWRNGVLIADYVACVRESDNEPSFYDFVSNTFKVPTRTGFFTAGQEI